MYVDTESKSENILAYEWPDRHSKSNSHFVPLPYVGMYIARAGYTVLMVTLFL